MSTGDERRKQKRVGCDMPLNFTYSVLEFGNIQKIGSMGIGVDISAEGMGFFTDTKLKPGYVIRIRRPDGIEKTAIVRWVGEIDGKFRVGVLLYR